MSVKVVDATASEPGKDTGQFIIQRTGNIDDALRVYYEMNGTATPGADYAPLRGSRPEETERIDGDKSWANRFS